MSQSSTGPRDPIVVARGAATRIGEVLGDLPGSFVTIADATAAGHHPSVLSALESLGKVITMELGEGQKNLRSVEFLLDALVSARIRRSDTIIGLGGGVATDITGFVASIYSRGVSCVLVPTTLLGQVDAAIGGKNGINLTGGKNLAGTFFEPSMLIIDPDLLTTLPQAEYLSGLAEVVKYGLSLDLELLNFLESSADAVLAREPEAVDRIIQRSVEIKTAIVASDPTESGPRMVLNYGHTFGHALEASGGYSRFRHGEAISVGMVVAARIARSIGSLGDQGVDKHLELFGKLGLPTSARFDIGDTMHLMEADKKFGKSQKWVLLERVGKASIRDDIATSAVLQAVEAVCE